MAPAIPNRVSLLCCSTGSGNILTTIANALGMVRAPRIPPTPRKMRKPNLLVVTKEVAREMAPRPTKPTSKMIDGLKMSDRRPANSRTAANYESQDGSTRYTHGKTVASDNLQMSAFVSLNEIWTYPCDLIDLKTKVDA